LSKWAQDPPSFPNAPPSTTVTKTSVRLDTLLKRYPPPDFIKLDVQGYELEVLKGGPQSLHAATAILMEASTLPINQGCPLIADVFAFMDQADFRLFDFCTQVRLRNGILWQTDLLFLKKARFPTDPSID
jgi:hypothetical protein